MSYGLVSAYSGFLTLRAVATGMEVNDNADLGRRAEYARASQKQREAAVSVTRTGDPSAAPATACASIHHVAKHSRYDKLKNATQ